MRKGGGLVGYGNHHLKIAWPALSLPICFHMPPSKAVIFSDDTPLQKKKLLSRFQLNILYYYMPLSHKDWELPNSWIWLAETDIDRGLDFPI